jgi:hypothetical protein
MPMCQRRCRQAFPSHAVESAAAQQASLVVAIRRNCRESITRLAMDLSGQRRARYDRPVSLPDR